MIVQFGGMSTTWMWVSITGWLVRRSAPLCFSQSWRSVRAINHPGNPSYGGYVDQWFRTWVFQSTPTENRLMDLPLWKSHSNHMEISSYGDLIYIYTWCMYIYIYVMYIMGIHWIYVLGPCSTFEYVVSIHFRSLKWARFYQPLKIGWFPSRCPIQGRLVDIFPTIIVIIIPKKAPGTTGNVGSCPFDLEWARPLLISARESKSTVARACVHEVTPIFTGWSCDFSWHFMGKVAENHQQMGISWLKTHHEMGIWWDWWTGVCG